MIWLLLAGVLIVLLATDDPAAADELPGDSAGTGADNPDTAPDMTNSFSAAIRDLAAAIAYAEGFGVPGAIPTRAHNPGDLVQPWRRDLPTFGSENVTGFPDDAAGWTALYKQLQLIADGRSHVYDVNLSIAGMAEKWTGGDRAGNWAANVATWYQVRQYDGVTIDTTIGELLRG